MLDIVLVEPEIPHNTGAIARTCAATGARLHLVKPLGFEISDKHVKRCGLDYWYLVDIRVYENIGEFFEKKGIYMVGTFHPSALLRTPGNKIKAFEDFQKIRNKAMAMGIL